MTGPSDLTSWAESFGTTHTLLADADKSAWDLYADSNSRPQIIVFDRELNIRYRGAGSSGHAGGEEAALDLAD